MDELSDDSSESSVDEIVSQLKLICPKSVINIEVYESKNEPSQLRRPTDTISLPLSSQNYCEPQSFATFDGLIKYSTDEFNNIPGCSHTYVHSVDKNDNSPIFNDSEDVVTLDNTSHVNSVNMNAGLFYDDDKVDSISDNRYDQPDNTNTSTSVNNNVMPSELFSDEIDNFDDPDATVDDPDWNPPSSPESNNEDVGMQDVEIMQDVENIQDTEGVAMQDITIGRERKQRKRKIHSNPSEWNDATNKRLREKGKTYKGWEKPKNGKGKRGPERGERKLGPPCNSEACKKSKLRQCQSIEINERDEIFSYFWEKLSWDQKKIYIVSLVTKSEKNRQKRSQERYLGKTFHIPTT